jgi:large subunit ribosomal protein L15
MPLQRRCRRSASARAGAMERDEIRLGELDSIEGEMSRSTLCAAGLIGRGIKRVKIIKSGSVEPRLQRRGVAVTAGAKAAIEAAGGTVAKAERRFAGHNGLNSGLRRGDDGKR